MTSPLYHTAPHSGDKTRPVRRACGFTLVEVLLSVMLVNVGLLALVASSAVLVRQTNELRIRTAATQAAVNRLQTMGATPCVAFAGVASIAGIREDFTAEMTAPRVRELRDSVSYAIGRQPHAVLLRTRLSC